MKTAARRRIAFVQPLLSPYSIPRFEELALDPGLEVIILLESDAFAHRPGWRAGEVKGCRVEVLRSAVVATRPGGRRAGIANEGVRTLPFGLPAALFRHRPEVVVVCNTSELLLAALARPFVGFRLALAVEDTPLSFGRRSPAGRWLKSRLWRRADLHLAMSEDSRSLLAELGIRETVRRTCWSLDLKARGRDKDLRRRTRQGLGLDERVVFLFVGQLVARKGLMPLLEAWSLLPPEARDEASLVVVGDGPQREAAEALIGSRGLKEVRLVGAVTYEGVEAWYSAADALVLPTLEDVFGLVVLEAMAAGLPVLTTAGCGAREMVREGENGHIFDPARPDDVRRVLLLALDQRERLPEMGRRARATADAYDNPAVVAALSEMLKDA